MAWDPIHYLQEHFPGLTLGGALFYRWPIGIRFDLGGRALTPEDFAEVQLRAVSLFEAVFAPEDECIVVAEDWPRDRDSCNHGQTHLSRLADFGIHHSIGLREPSGRIEGHQAEHDEGLGTPTLTWFDQFARDFRYDAVFSGIANADHGRDPGLCTRVYFLNPRINAILHMYDDRGLDVIAESTDALANLFREFNAWVLEYDRARIDQIFGRTHT